MASTFQFFQRLTELRILRFNLLFTFKLSEFKLLLQKLALHILKLVSLAYFGVFETCKIFLNCLQLDFLLF